MLFQQSTRFQPELLLPLPDRRQTLFNLIQPSQPGNALLQFAQCCMERGNLSFQRQNLLLSLLSIWYVQLVPSYSFSLQSLSGDLRWQLLLPGPW